ncbi:uncharacterized protein F5Z01DRAFT_664863 [Emericellopsis atlantica]|uniref:Uncharacterized protein n=1 Tax=Emericellopsis atlantica TaxID=2614577 RepID=A0A9P7ZF10_9HYPO|nr:uncharacterized protein F5Z01DRAFT_664863 [Emericellopsis atlantica]KAG9250939.1 hypothetical protein F5Z01DRAFT_664863 [Emericellopsis atlantica]
MDDPWGSPWDTNENGSIAAIQLVTPPPAVAFNTNTRKQSPAPPWGEEEDEGGWGGWNAASAPGAESPGWGRSPGLKPVSPLRSRSVSPVPWGQRADDSGLVGSGPEADAPPTALEKPTSTGSHKVSDDDFSDTSHHQSEGKHDEPQPSSPTRAESPDGPPPGPALRIERPDVSRKGSKVQGLVDLYDGISRHASPLDKTLPSLDSPLEAPSEDEESEGESSSSTSTAVSGVLEQDPDPAAGELEPHESEDFGDQTVIVDETAYHEPDLADDPPAQTPYAKKVVPTALPIDLSLLDDLFPQTHPSTTAPEPLPPNIIDDTFATPGERRTWYRVSRFGSSRKHDHGNDENYVHMDWAHSTVRKETLQTVRRWMEEDSIAGRGVGLAHRAKGAIGGGKMFGWDRTGADVEPVDVDALLKRNRRISAREERPRTASFGWSSSGDSPSAGVFPPPPFMKSRPQSMVPAANDAVEREKLRPKSLIIPPPKPMDRPSLDQVVTPILHSPGSMLSAAPITGVAEEGEEDDDDDWGEMVTSPTAPASAVLETVVTGASDPATSNATPTGNGIFESGSAATSPTAPVSGSDRTAKPLSPLKFETFVQPINQPLPPQQPFPEIKPLVPSPSLSPGPMTLPAQPTTAGSTKPATTHREMKHQLSQGDEDTAAKILRNLPDLTYMLR